MPGSAARHSQHRAPEAGRPAPPAGLLGVELPLHSPRSRRTKGRKPRGRGREQRAAPGTKQRPWGCCRLPAGRAEMAPPRRASARPRRPAWLPPYRGLLTAIPGRDEPIRGTRPVPADSPPWLQTARKKKSPRPGWAEPGSPGWLLRPPHRDWGLGLGIWFVFFFLLLRRFYSLSVVFSSPIFISKVAGQDLLVPPWFPSSSNTITMFQLSICVVS